MFISALFTIAKIWRQHKCLSTDEWIMKMEYYTMEYQFNMENNENSPFVTTWMNLEGIMPNKISQTKTNTLPLPFIFGSKTQNKFMNITKRKQTHREQTGHYQWEV